MREGVQHAAQVLEQEVPPGDAVIAAWVALESSAEQTGIHRDRAQTATEFTIEVLRGHARRPAAPRRSCSTCTSRRGTASTGSRRRDVAAGQEQPRDDRARGWGHEGLAALRRRSSPRSGWRCWPGSRTSRWRWSGSRRSAGVLRADAARAAARPRVRPRRGSTGGTVRAARCRSSRGRWSGATDASASGCCGGCARWPRPGWHATGSTWRIRPTNARSRSSLGSQAFRTLTRTRSPHPTMSEVRQAIDALERIGPPPRKSGRPHDRDTDRRAGGRAGRRDPRRGRDARRRHARPAEGRARGGAGRRARAVRGRARAWARRWPRGAWPRRSG